MRCSQPKEVKLEKWPWAEGVFSQLKADGMFMNVSVEADQVEFRSRQGSEFTLDALGELVDTVRASLTAGFQYHGELLVQRADGNTWSTLPRAESNGVMNSLGKGGSLPFDHRLIYLVWDMIPLSAVVPKGRYEVPYKERFALLSDLTQKAAAAGRTLIELIPTKIVYSLEEAQAHHKEVLAAGLEGTVRKRPDGIWRDGDSPDQCKHKLKVVVELEVIGFNEGKGKYAGTLGTFHCASQCRRLCVDVNVLGDKLRDEIWASQADWLSSILAVDANGITVPRKAGGLHSLSLPIMVERRFDKREADTLERIQAQFEAAIFA